MVWQEAVVPPPEPVQVHVHGPLPETGVAVPTEQKPPDGAVAEVKPLVAVSAGPQAPFTAPEAIVTVAVVQPETPPWLSAVLALKVLVPTVVQRLLGLEAD